MGLFLAASVVVDRDGDTVRDGVAAFVASVGGTFEPRTGTTEDQNIGVIQAAEKSTTILYPDGFTEWDEVSKCLSTTLNTPVFSFHIHDGDLWMLVAFEDGREVAWFNPIPDYWGDVSADELAKWAGDANIVAGLVPGATPASIEKYFRVWTEDVVCAETKAYDDDEFATGVDWQLTDFMRRLGFVYPIDENGMPVGQTYFLKIQHRRPPLIPDNGEPPQPKPLNDIPVKQPAKPWWRFW